jgi:DNA ligase (NAD+)
MVDKETLEEVLYLRREIQRHDNLYYNGAFTAISDIEYDKLRQRLKALELEFPEIVTEDSPSYKIGASVNSEVDKIKHLSPMLSLDNAFTTNDLEDFLDRISKFLIVPSSELTFCSERKIDGLSASAVYEDGNLKYVATRGDGYYGENITQNAKTICDLPHRIDFKGSIEVRGEIYMPIASFVELNELRKISSERLFANPRNAAAGSVRCLDSSVSASRNLKFFAYHINESSNSLGLNTQYDVLATLERLGFIVAPSELCDKSTGLDGMINFYEKVLRERSHLEYEIDGVVFKLNALDLQNRLGFVGRNPRHSIAFKFPAEEAKTKIIEISVNVGRSGKVTPIAILEPVVLCGATVSRATLHNFDEIRKKNIALGDTVSIMRSGDVIPKIVSVDSGSHSPRMEGLVIPKCCPACGSELVKYDGGIDLFCNNRHACPSQIVKYITYFSSKNCFNICGFGEKQIEEFYNEERIKSVIDVFKLEEMDHLSPLAQKPGWGEVSARKLFKSIAKARIVSLPKFITALGIPGVGDGVALMLANEFENMDALFSATTEDLLAIPGLGEITVNDISEFFKNESKRKLISELLDLVSIETFHGKSSHNETNRFFGKTIVFTGKLLKLSRSEAKLIASSMGAVVASAISSKTDFLIVGENPGTKLKKAIDFGIVVLTENEFISEQKDGQSHFSAV